jgi:predicted O-methyltransferase YrrM
MKTFDEVMNITQDVSGSPALENVEAKGLYDASLEVPTGGLVVEIGCELGRSSSILAQVGAGRFHTVHIDPYIEHPEYLKSWADTMHRVGGTDHAFTLFCMRTEQAAWYLDKLGSIDLAFIDGDHEYPGVKTDLRLVADKIRPGGLLTAHDYAGSSVELNGQPNYPLPGVKKALDEYIDDRWETVGVFGSLGVWRRK